MLLRTFCIVIVAIGFATSVMARTVKDSSGCEYNVPDEVKKVICSGPGSLRLLTYLQAERLIVGVDDLETRHNRLDSRPYAIANPWFRKMELFGEFRGHDNPERILSLARAPQVIFKTFGQMGHDPVELEQKTGIPVVKLLYGNLTDMRNRLYDSLRLMGEIIGKKQRAEEVIRFFEDSIRDLEVRTARSSGKERPVVFLGGVSSKGPHGFQSTEPSYPPFEFVHANNPAAVGGVLSSGLSHSQVAKEQIIAWDPDYLFIDLSTTLMGDDAGGLYELQNDPAYQSLTAVQGNRVFGVLPYNLYATNYGSILANAYFIGKLLYPEQFDDVDPVSKADEIYTFLIGSPVFSVMDRDFANQVFKRIKVW